MPFRRRSSYPHSRDSLCVCDDQNLFCVALRPPSMLAVFSVHYPAFVHTTGAYAPAPRPAWRSGASPIAVEYAVDVPYQEAEYDPAAASAFFEKRPLVAIRRALQIVRRSGGFVISTLLDKKLGREEQMVDRRSQELLELVTDLGVINALSWVAAS